MRAHALAGLVVACLGAGACRDDGAQGARGPERPRHVVDLTHTLSPRFPFIPVQNKTFPFRIAPIATLAQDGVYANRWELTEHVGTHLDAPSHFAEGGRGVDQIPVDDLLAPVVVLDIAARAARSPDASLAVDDLRAWEGRHGRIPDGAAVFLRTGWEARAGDAAAFVNLDAQQTMHFPGFSEEAIAWLLAERSIRGIGIDTLSVDPGADTHYAGHRRLLRAGKWAIECLANLAQLPPAGAAAFIGAVKVEGASGAPARVVAFW